MKTVDRILGESGEKTPEEAYRYALLSGGRWPEGESTIAYDPEWAYRYARNVIGGRWPEAEENIAKNAHFSYWYAVDVIGGRFPEAEDLHFSDPQWAFLYAVGLIKGRWPKAEPTIANSEYKDHYLEKFPDAKDDWILNGWLDWLDS